MKYLALVTLGIATLATCLRTTSAEAASLACLDCFAGCSKTSTGTIEECVMACKNEHKCPVTFVTFDIGKQRIEKIVHNGGSCAE